MISTALNCIFVHIPKTGGTSVEDVLWPGPRTEADLWQGTIDRYRNKYQTGGLQHLLARHIREEVGEDKFSAAYRFSFVRNPWDRTISQFLYMQQREDLRSFIGMKENDSLARYLVLIRDQPHVQWTPQCDFLDDQFGNCLVEFVGRFERLAEDAKAVFDRLGVSCENLPHRLKNSRTHYTDYYDQETKNQVARLFERDIDRFSYTF
jgi:hypothetical protein